MEKELPRQLQGPGSVSWFLPMLTFQLTYALSDKLLTIFERASQLGQRLAGTEAASTHFLFWSA